MQVMLRGTQINYMPEKSHVVVLISVSHSLTLVVGWPHRSYKIEASYAVSRYLTLWLRDAA